MADKSFEAEFLQTHNTYRSQHGAPPLTMNQTLCRSAQSWAEHLLSIRTLKHSDGSYGENVYYSYSSVPKKLTGREAVDSWYSEIKDYRFNRPGFTSGTGHFTQVVWKDTRELGVGVATNGTMTFVVGQYLPAGNISNPGYFEKNVLPSGSAADTKPTPTRPVGGAGTASGNIQPPKPAGKDSWFSPLKPRPSGDIGSTQPQKSTDKSFEAEFLQTHNTYRSQHGAPPLTMNQTLCRSAQSWAEHLLSIRTLKHSDGSYGENVYYSSSSVPKKLTGHEAVDSWYSEIKDYRFNRPGFTSGTGHFTQVVWKDTRELGVGVATNGTMTFVVGQYLPAGNISNPGYFEKNVLPSGSAADTKPTPTRPVGGAGTASGNIQPPKPAAKDSWFSEIKGFHPMKPGPSSEAGQVTQMVWRETKETGGGGSSTTVVSRTVTSGHFSNFGFERNVPSPRSMADGKSTITDLVQFRNQLLAVLNRYRQRHGVQPVTLCPALSKEAQEWAAHLVSTKTLKNSQRGHGESMSYKWMSTLEAPSADEVAESWYNESKKYNFSTPGFQSEAGNFTQMVWKSTERAGVGLATDGKGMFITVVFYEPAGNISNRAYFQDNVKPAC
ncbi:GLI pathogenesis-related 2 [Brachyhypopomus gauderio]|uniref:GLI pathogenesis-related 2 n=1 Tax=Brachyhypopomus gauderio TaxID=698409 RepID=UPI004041D054